MFLVLLLGVWYSLLTRILFCERKLDAILHSHRRENLKSYIRLFCLYLFLSMLY
jgi:hypothetical protein